MFLSPVRLSVSESLLIFFWAISFSSESIVDRYATSQKGRILINSCPICPEVDFKISVGGKPKKRQQVDISPTSKKVIFFPRVMAAVIITRK